jgi:hypothetical protein
MSEVVNHSDRLRLSSAVTIHETISLFYVILLQTEKRTCGCNCALAFSNISTKPNISKTKRSENQPSGTL